MASTFINVLPSFADKKGRIHPEFKTLGPKGGRFSCSNPNVQQMPARSALGKRLRQAFIAEAGNKLVIADYSQMELRVLAHYSGDPLLVQAYTGESETDLHTLTASRMFNREVGEVTKAERSVAKMINFGIAYGITPKGLFNRLRPEGHQVTMEECERFIQDYFAAYKGVVRFLRKVESVIRKRGYVMSLFGRRRRLQGSTRREVRQAQNFIIQETAADIAKDAMVRLHNQLLDGAYLITQVHDEFIVECREADAERVRELVMEVMTQAPEGFTIPLKVDAHIVNNWEKQNDQPTTERRVELRHQAILLRCSPENGRVDCDELIERRDEIVSENIIGIVAPAYELKELKLPAPRIWKPEHLADFFGFSVHWVYKLTRKSSPDPPPRCRGFRLIRFDTQSKEFPAWILHQLACYSTIGEEEENGV